MRLGGLTPRTGIDQTQQHSLNRDFARECGAVCSNKSDAKMIEIKNRWSGAVIRVVDAANLCGANLSDANLCGAVLRDADGNPLPRATPAQAIENLDKVRAIVMDNRDRLNMGHWHGDNGWKERTCAEETLCGTTHCMAGWLQVCSTEPALKEVDAYLAGVLAAPVAAKMFYRGDAEALAWLESRAYVAETEEAERRAAERAARKAGAA
jgi:hypothetical protein